MIAQKNIIETMPVEKAPSPIEDRPYIARNQSQQKKNRTLFIASDVCLLVGLLLIVIAMLLPIGVVTAIEAVFALSLVLLITEVSLFVVGGELFVLGFVWPKIK
jgi:hypothetical protein